LSALIFHHLNSDSSPRRGLDRDFNVVVRSVSKKSQGLLIVPDLLPSRTQKVLLSRLLHRDLNNPQHLTNIHFHHTLPYQAEGGSFFDYPLDSQIQCEPIDSNTHKPIPISSLLNKKLRWITLGGQYDWTAKKYPSSKPPDFPSDVSQLLEELFPDTKAQAAIVNLYTPGDTLSIHRDVSEQSGKGLISISLGCDALFMIGLGPDHVDTPNESILPPLILRLRSGDAVIMSGPSRFAWHGVPQVIRNTCPDFLENWPADDGDSHDIKYDHWKGWMQNKRINLNVRQMWD
jgi:alkylated DNA repair protein alkB family protein 1